MKSTTDVHCCCKRSAECTASLSYSVENRLVGDCGAVNVGERVSAGDLTWVEADCTVTGIVDTLAGPTVLVFDTPVGLGMSFEDDVSVGTWRSVALRSASVSG